MRLWDAVVTFRAQAASVIHASSSSATPARFHGLLEATLLSGVPVLVLVLVLRLRGRRGGLRARPSHGGGGGAAVGGGRRGRRQLLAALPHRARPRSRAPRGRSRAARGVPAALDRRAPRPQRRLLPRRDRRRWRPRPPRAPTTRRSRTTCAPTAGRTTPWWSASATPTSSTSRACTAPTRSCGACPCGCATPGSWSRPHPRGSAGADMGGRGRYVARHVGRGRQSRHGHAGRPVPAGHDGRGVRPVEAR